VLSDVDITHSKLRQCEDQLAPEPFGRIMRRRPPRRSDKFLRSGIEGTQVFRVSTAPIVNHRIKFEVDLIKAIAEIDGEGRADLDPMCTIKEPLWQTEVEKVRRSRIEPIFWKVKVECNLRNGASQLVRKRLRRGHFGARNEPHDINVLRCPI